MEQPYRKPAIPEDNTVKTLKKDVGKITIDFYYRDKDDKVVCKQITYVGSYDGYRPRFGGHSFVFASHHFSALLSSWKEELIYWLPGGLIINRDRMIEIRYKTEVFEVEYLDQKEP